MHPPSDLAPLLPTRKCPVRVHPRAIEAGVALAFGLLGFAHLALFVHALSTTGLWHDEIVSIQLFSSQGLWTTLTTYPVPNNHIFFNALASLIPWTDPFDPFAARFWSFLATGLLGASCAFALARRRSFLEAGLLIHLLFMSRELLALNLQARGYGLVCLFAMLSGLLVWRHERVPDRVGPMVALGGVSLLGIWTIPSYALFAAPLMAMAALSGNRRRNASIGLATIAVIALVHAPVAAEIVSSTRGYANAWGHQLDTLDELAAALRLYLFHDESFVKGPNDVAIGLLWLGLAALALRSGRSAEARTARKLIGSAVFLVAVSFALGTPPPRTLVPALVAFALATVLIVRAWLPPERFAGTRCVLAVALALVIVPHDLETLDRFDFVPRERWKTIAEFIGRILPEDMEVTVRFRPQQLELYTTNPARLRDDVIPAEFDAGRSAVLLNGLDPTSENDPLARDPRLAAIRFKQNRGRHQTIHVAPPERSLIEHVTLVELVERDRAMDLSAATDRDLTTRAETVRAAGDAFRYVELHADLEGDVPVRSLLLVFEQGTTVGRVKIEARLDDGTSRRISETKIVEWGSTVAVDLGLEQSDVDAGRRIERLILRIRPHAVEGQRVFSLRELWAYPMRFDRAPG